MALSEEEKSRAAAIVDRWFWQIDESRQYRFAGATKRLVRFYESAPLSADVFALVLEYLRSMENVAEISLNHKNVQLEGKWNAIGAWYATAQGSQWAGTESAKVRVYQALGAASELSAGDIYEVENGCKYKVSHTFFWDVATAPNVPKGSSGVQYSVQGLSRDKETGLYSYVLEKRETVQQDVELYESAKTIFETRSEEVHHGVKASAVASTGAAASAGGGKLVERRITKNPDCTSDVQIVEREETSVEGAVKTARKTLRGTVVSHVDRNQTQPLSMEGLAIGETRRSEKTPGGLYDNTTEQASPEPVGKIGEEVKKTIFETSEETLTNQEKEPTDAVADAANGVVKSRTVRKTEEGTVDVTERTDTELRVSNAVRTARKTLRGTVVSHVDRNQTQPLSMEGLAIGETRRSEKTPGGRYDNTTEQASPESVGRIATAKEETIFESTNETLDNLSDNPEDPKNVDQFEQTLEGVGNGVVKSRTVRKTEEGTIDVTEKEITEKTVEKSRRTVHTTPFRTVITFRDTAAEDFTGKVSGDFPIQQVKAHSTEDPDADGAGTAREVNLEATRGGKQTTEKVYVFPKAVSWSTPELNSTFKYKRTWFFRNFDKRQYNSLAEQAAGLLSQKVSDWILSDHPPQNHDIDMSLTLNDDGFFDGNVVIFATWAEDSSGREGNTDFIISDIEYEYYSFDFMRDRHFDKAIDGSSKFKAYKGIKVHKRRIVGCGIRALQDLLDVGKSVAFGGYEPQIAFNSKTLTWTVELVTGINNSAVGVDPAVLISPSELNPLWIRSSINNALQKYRERVPITTGEDVDINDTEFS